DGEHVAVLVEEGPRVLLSTEVATLPAPVGPRARHAIEHLARVRLPAKAFLLGSTGKRPLVRSRTPQPGGDLRFLNPLQARWHARLAEVLLGQDVGRHRAPMLGNGEVLQGEDDGAVRILDLRRGAAEGDLLVG